MHHRQSLSNAARKAVVGAIPTIGTAQTIARPPSNKTARSNAAMTTARRKIRSPTTASNRGGLSNAATTIVSLSRNPLVIKGRSPITANKEDRISAAMTDRAIRQQLWKQGRGNPRPPGNKETPPKAE